MSVCLGVGVGFMFCCFDGFGFCCLVLLIPIATVLVVGCWLLLCVWVGFGLASFGCGWFYDLPWFVYDFLDFVSLLCCFCLLFGLGLDVYYWCLISVFCFL